MRSRKQEAAPKQITPDWWQYEHLDLVCSTCKQKLNENYRMDDFKSAENLASYLAIDGHKCAPSQLKLKSAKELMILYRAKHPNITLDEQMEVYKLILST